MIKEHIEYIDGLPIKVFISSIDEYPIHMHNELEVIYVVEGEIELKDCFYNYILTQGDIYIVNMEDLHSIHKKSSSNLIMFLQIDLNHFKKYHPYVDKIIYICDSYYNKKHNEKTERIKEYLAQIMMEVSNQKTGYRKRVQALVNTCLLNFINNFQYASLCSLEEKKLKNENKYKGKRFQIQRIHRIIEYIYLNYNKNISLEEIANREHISKYYLTHLLKYGVGYGFQDIINLVRVEMSEVLLLGTEKPIGDIVYECGFSSHRYYNKHFQKFFGMTPSKYRKKYKDKTIAVRKIKYLNYDKEKAMKKIESLIYTSEEDEHIVNSFEGIINIIEIDFTSEDSKRFDHYWNNLNLLKINQGLTLEYQKHLEEFQKEIYFESIRLNLFDCMENSNRIYNWEWLNQLLDTFNKVRITPTITIHYEKLKTSKLYDEFPQILNNFIVFCINKHGYETIKSWKLEIQCNMKDNKYNDFVKKTYKIIKTHKMKVLKEKSVINYTLNPLNDTEFMPCFIINNIMKNDKEEFKDNILLVDYFKDYLIKDSFFYGGSGLITTNGLRKSAYYAFFLLSKLGNEMITKGDGYIVTQNNDNYQILIYNYDEASNQLFMNEKIELKEAEKQLYSILNTKKEFILRLMNINDKYIIKRYKIDKESGFAYRHWQYMGQPQSISHENEELIKTISFPKTTFSHIEEKNFYDLHIALEPFNVELIIFEKRMF